MQEYTLLCGWLEMQIESVPLKQPGSFVLTRFEVLPVP